MLDEYQNLTVEMSDASVLLRKLSTLFLENQWIHRHPVRVNVRFNNLCLISHRVEKNNYDIKEIVETIFDEFPQRNVPSEGFGPIALRFEAEPQATTLRMFLDIRGDTDTGLFKNIEQYLHNHMTFNDMPEHTNFLEAGVPLEMFISEFLTPISWGLRVPF
jgi:hypothetical protein